MRSLSLSEAANTQLSSQRSALDMEVCTTLGMLSPEQAIQLKAAGLTAYNHNLDTSREFYPKVRFALSKPFHLATANSS